MRERLRKRRIARYVQRVRLRQTATTPNGLFVNRDSGLEKEAENFLGRKALNAPGRRKCDGVKLGIETRRELSQHAFP